MIEKGDGALVVVANRLPIAWEPETSRWQTSPGGLVSALVPILQRRAGTWVGWAGSEVDGEIPSEVDGITQVPVHISSDEYEDYYLGFCNGTIWPLYHDAIRPVEMHRHWWRPYQTVNRRFADAVAEVTDPDAAVWIQDYQLQLVPHYLRQRFPERRIAFFLHIPFPPLEIFARLPWRSQVVKGMLGADVVGLHTHQGVLNFARAARRFGGASGPAEALAVEGRTVRVESVPISIDTAEFERVAASPEVGRIAEDLMRDLGHPKTVILGVDRLDYTKGIDIRLRAFANLLERRPDLAGGVSFVQVAVPSREAVGEYQIIRERVEQLVGRINGEHGRPGWVPVHYLHRSLDRDDLVALYRSADIMLITPLRDGMNLVAKEYIASRLDETGVLVLSEFAGAAEQLGRALIVNPYDIDGLTATLEHAIELDVREQKSRMRPLRRNVQRWDVHRWANACLAAIDA